MVHSFGKSFPFSETFSISCHIINIKLIRNKFKLNIMNVSFGHGKTEFGPGVQIDLTGPEVARAIYTYLTAHGVYINGAATITVNGELCEYGGVYVDPSGKVVANGEGYNGAGHKD
jgi:hypothetical protein